MLHHLLFPIVLILTLLSCGGAAPQTDAAGSDAAAAPATGTYLRMKINGVPWEATEEITGNLGLLGEGQFGLGGGHIVDGEEQNFVIILHGVTASGGTFVTDAASTYNAAQYSVSSTDGDDVRIFKSQQDGAFTVRVSRANKFSTEGTFSGTLPGWLNTNETVTITDGMFRTE